MPENGTDAVTLGAGVVKRPTRLADGRELIYYDDPGTTLGPEANEAHRNHFHVDMAERTIKKICD